MEAHTLALWQPLLDQARRLREDKSWVAVEPRYPTANPRPPDSGTWKYLLSETLDPQMHRATISQITHLDVEQQLALTALAPKRYTLQNGSLPATLAALVPDWLPVLPTDPMDGKPLCYRTAEGKDFVLYSVGSNGKDDGGNPQPLAPGPTRAQDRWAACDVLWPTATAAP